MAWLSIIFAAIPAVIYLAAGLPVTAGTVSIGTLIAFTTLQNSLFRPITGLLSTSVSVISSLALFARIFEYLDLPVEVDEPARPVSIDPAQVTGHVRLEDVSFTYPGADRPALVGINLDVPAGSTLALVGETGSGKTTLGSLVARLYDPGRGTVRTDIRDLRLADLAAIVGVVSQESYLLHTTVRENLRYAKPGASDAEIEDAARAAQIHDLIASLPDGHDTMVGSRGHPLLRRRKAAHRHRPRAAARPARTRARRGHQRHGHRNRTGRPAGIRHPGPRPHHHHHRAPPVHRHQRSPIAVLDHGRIIEAGDHTSLLAGHGRYAELAA
jgi:ATP-binding cassette, subfamily B, bacterial